MKIKLQQDGQIEGEPELYGTTKLTADETWKEWVTVQYASLHKVWVIHEVIRKIKPN